MVIGYVLDDTLDRSDGVQQAVITIAEKMRSLGHEVHYIVAETERTDLQNIHAVAKVLKLKFNGNSIRTPIWSSKKQLKKLFSEVVFDVLHVQMPYSPFMAGRVIRMAPRTTRIVGTFHILPYNWMARYGTKVLGWVLHRTNKHLTQSYAVSPPALEFMQKGFGLSGEVLGNPINYEFFHSFSVAKKSGKSKLRMVFIGRFEERKGVAALVEAYGSMKHRNEVELIMCGKGPLWETLNSKIQSENLGITMPGFVSEEEKAQYLSSADIAVFPSISGESFGIVLTEAMSAGAGITIGGNNPGYASVLGVWPEALFDPRNIQEFTQFLDNLVTNPQLCKRIGDQQHQDVKKYDINLIAETLLKEAYQELANS